MNYQTGDLLLFKGNAWYSRIIEYFGHSAFSHIGMILVDPSFIPEKGIYVLHSGRINSPDVEDHKIKFGVQIDKLNDVIQNETVCVKHLHCTRDTSFYNTLEQIHNTIHNKPYDICLKDWLIVMKIEHDKSLDNFSLQKTSSFWCSALIAYIYYKLNLISFNGTFPWSLIAPKEFSDNTNNLFTFNCTFDKLITLH